VSLELPVLVPTFAEAERIARFDERAERLAEAFWPCPLTLVLPRAGDSEAWDLGGDRTTIGVRLPGHRLARAVLDRYLGAASSDDA
jgi:L-threonylcarbamoyladenylate synthase